MWSIGSCSWIGSFIEDYGWRGSVYTPQTLSRAMMFCYHYRKAGTGVRRVEMLRICCSRPKRDGNWLAISPKMCFIISWRRSSSSLSAVARNTFVLPVRHFRGSDGRSGREEQRIFRAGTCIIILNRGYLFFNDNWCSPKVLSAFLDLRLLAVPIL
eukprot:IDg15752t1